MGMDENSASARMNQYEKGKHAPDFDTMKRMSEVLDVPVAYFFCETELDAKLTKALDKLSEDQKKILLEKLTMAERTNEGEPFTK